MFGRLKGPLVMVSSCRAESIETRTEGGGGASDPATSEVPRIQLHSMSIHPILLFPNRSAETLKIRRPKLLVKHPSSRPVKSPGSPPAACPTVPLTCHPDAVPGHLTCPTHPHRGG